MYPFIDQIFTNLTGNDNHVTIAAVYLVAVASVVVLRIIAHLHHRTVLLSFRFDAKDLKNRDDVRKYKNGLLRKVATEYIRVAEKAVTKISTASLVDRALARISFIGWRYVGVMPFIETMESGFLWIGLILALISGEYAFVYGLLAVSAFLLTRVVAAFFDFRSARAQLADEIIIYVEREIGRFFSSDSGGAVLRLKNELTEIIGKQTTVLENAVRFMTDKLTQTTADVAKNMTEASASIGPALAAAVDEKLINMNENLTVVMNDWEKALGNAGRVQTAMNDSAEKLSLSGQRIQNASEMMAKYMHGHSNALSEQLIALVGAIESVKEGIDLFAAQQEALTKQSHYIERNQHILETAIESYESSLKNLTVSLGESLGAFINLHAQTSAQTVNDALKTNFEKIKNLTERK